MISVRPTVYHDRPGFLVGGRDSIGRLISIFVTTRPAAYRIRQKVREGLPITRQDLTDD